MLEIAAVEILGAVVEVVQGDGHGLVPAVEQLPNGYWKVVRLRKEHGELRDAIEAFRTAVTLETYVGPQTREQLLWRLVNEARSILAMLRAHATFEIELTREIKALAP